jgi:allantoin racemase
MPVAPDVELASQALDRGPATVESYYDEYVGAMDMVEKALAARKDGFDAIAINCFMNPTLEGLRELLDIPVVGAGEAAVHVASLLGDNFSIIDPGPPNQTYPHRMAAAAGLLHKLKSVRYLSLGVSGLSGDFDTIFRQIVDEAVKAVKEDGAHVIVFGCTGMRRYAEKLAGEMEKYGVPVVEPITAAVNVAELLVRLRLKPSKITYPKPPEKKRVF